MPNPFQIAGAALPASDFAPLHVNRMTTGMWPNTNPLRDASTTGYVEKNYGGKGDSIYGGQNCEISQRLTLIRRPGCKVYNSQIFPAINRFYGWNTFDTHDEFVRVMADTGMGGGVVYDATGPNTKTAIFTKSAGAKSTYFLGVGNTLYMTNGVDNIQVDNATSTATKWGVDAPVNAPTVTQQARPNTYPSPQRGTVYSTHDAFGLSIEELQNDAIQRVTTFGVTGNAEPNPWNPGYLLQTISGTTAWQNMSGPGGGSGPGSGWTAGFTYAIGDPIIGTVIDSSGLNVATLFWCIAPGVSGSTPPNWISGVGSLTADGPAVMWKNGGNLLYWADIGPGTTIVGTPTVLDPNGYLQTVLQPGKTGATPPTTWATILGAYTTDGTLIWVNAGPFAVAGTAPVQYGYAYQKSGTVDISNMSPASIQTTVAKGGQLTIQGDGTGQAGVDVIPIYRTAQGGSTFLLRDTIPNPGAGMTWTYIDNNFTDAVLNPEIQAQVGGEGTPLPSGATCLAYHLGRIFAAVDNVVYVSSGPDAIASGSSGNAGFDTTFTCQSKIIRFWVTSLGVVVFTLRDAYLIQGSATDTDPLYMTTWIENLPLLHYDAFTTLLSTAYLFGGQRMVQQLDAGSGITEASFPIAPIVNQIDPATAFLTMHTGGSGETALYLADGTTLWYRMAPTSAPESGNNWSPAALIAGGMSALQSVEVLPGTTALLIGPPASAPGPIRVRDVTTRTDAGIPYPVSVDYNPIVLANPGQLAGLAWMTLKCSIPGNAPKLKVVLDEIGGAYEDAPRTRQDPTNLPPSASFISNRHSLLQNQNPVWCQVIKFGLEWGATDTPDELLTYTIFGQTWAEQRSQ